MPLSFGEGVAAAIHANTLRSGSSYTRDRVRVRELEAMNAKLIERINQLESELAVSRQESKANHDKSVVNARCSSAGLIVMNGVIRALENMPSETREKFRMEVVDYSQRRILELDTKYINLANQGGYEAKTIMGVFKNEPEFKKLGFKE